MAKQRLQKEGAASAVYPSLFHELTQQMDERILRSAKGNAGLVKYYLCRAKQGVTIARLDKDSR